MQNVHCLLSRIGEKFLKRSRWIGEDLDTLCVLSEKFMPVLFPREDVLNSPVLLACLPYLKYTLFPRLHPVVDEVCLARCRPDHQCRLTVLPEMGREGSPGAGAPYEFSPLVARPEYSLYIWWCEVFDRGVWDPEADDDGGLAGGTPLSICSVVFRNRVVGREVEMGSGGAEV